MEERKPIRATLRELGIRAKSKVLQHLCVDNAYDKNLLPDISKCDYLEGHQGRTELQPLDGLPPFVDDIFVYGYVRKKDLFQVGGKHLCANAQGIAKYVSGAARETYGRYLQPTILHTVLVGSGGVVGSTVAEIERRVPNREAWKELYGEDPAAIFVCKVGCSELAIQQVEEGIELFGKLLQRHCMGIYSIDYTQDFSGTLDRPALVDRLHSLGFEDQHIPGEREGTILDNTNSVGEHVCTWVANGCRTKIYNKIVCNFEAGEVQKPMGGKLAEYVDCPNAHLRQTFQHPEVQKRGCTRIEISVYGRDFSKNNTNAIQQTLEFVDGCFVVQPPRQLWNNLAKHLDRCMVVCCQETREIFLAWYCHIRTGRVVGIRVRGDPERWEQSVLWTMAEFGFRRCPIFRVDVVSLEPIEIPPLRCYTKDGPTTLAESNMPTKIHKDAPRIAFYLPSTQHIEWQWRTKKAQKIGVEKSNVDLWEVESDRSISLQSRRSRKKWLEEIEDALEGDRWAEATKEFYNTHAQKVEEEKRRLEEENKKIRAAIEERKETLQKLDKRERLLGRAFFELSVRRIETFLGEYKILGYKRPRDIDPNWKCRGHRIALYSDKVRLVWATEQLLDLVEQGNYHNGVAIPGEEIVVQLRNGYVESATVPGKEIRMEDYQEKTHRVPDKLQWKEAPPSKERVQALHMEEGEYQCYYWCKIEFRGKPRTILFLQDRCDSCTAGECMESHPTTAVWGHFLEAQKIDRRAPLYCRIGKEKTTKNKKKDRLVFLSTPG